MNDTAEARMFHGAPIACERIEGKNDNMSGPHFHDYFELYYLESGERHVRVQDDVFDLNAGMLIIHPPFRNHFGYSDRNVYFKRICLYFRHDIIKSSALREQLRESFGAYVLDPAHQAALYRTLQTLLYEEEHEENFKYEYMQSLLNMLLIDVLRQSQHVAPHNNGNRMLQILTYVNDHYNENLTLQLLSEKFFISPYHFCREFKKMTGKSFIQYLNMTRVMHAQMLIVETSQSMTDIAAATGLGNASNFTRVFKHVTGTTPIAYRKSNSMISDIQYL